MEHTQQSLSKERIQELALEEYPENMSPNRRVLFKRDVFRYEREIYIEGLNKASSMLYNQEQLRQAFDAGRFSSVDGKHFGHFMESLKEQ